MSDISVQTAPDVTPTPPEVTIPDQGAAGGSGEIGQQTPSKTQEQVAMERQVSRRASIERAYAKAQDDAKSRAAAKASEASKADASDASGKPGERPQGKPVEKPQGRQLPDRGEHGHFQARQPAQPDAGQQPDQQPRKYAPLHETAPYREAPPRFSDAAKADWHGVPESVRGATTQAFQQYEQGLQQYRQAAEAFHEVRDYHDMAIQHGTSLRTALDNYVGMEHRLRGDLFGGLDLIVNNLGFKHPDGSKVTFGDVAAAYLSMSPEQRQMGQAQNRALAQDGRMGQLYQTVQSLANTVQQMQYHQSYSANRSAIDQFADTHPGFDQRSDLIKEELEHGYPLDVAYRRAMLLRPGNGSTQAAQTRNTSAQTRDEMDRSISGAPNGGANVSHRPPKKSGSNREALTNALRRVRSGV